LRARGALDLRFRWDARRRATYVETLAQASPLKVLRAFRHGSTGALVHLHNVSGGVLAGDQLSLAVRVETRSHALLTTTGATRIYLRRGDEAPARQALTAVVEDGARLEYLPDPTIPYRASALEQTLRWHLHGGAGLLAWDVLAPGRQGFEEDFSFRLYANDTAVYWNGAPIVLERYALLPERMNLRSLARMSHGTHLGTLMFFDGSQTTREWLELEAEAHRVLDGLARELASPSLMCGVSATFRQGLAVRALGGSSQEILLAFERLREFLLRRVWGASSPLPRKIY
jgi:urease accessory protein